MNNLAELKDHWIETKGKLKQNYALLTDNDVKLEEGKQEEMLFRLQTVLGKTKEEMHKIINEL